VPGLAALRHGQPHFSLGAISCPSPGSCAAAGTYYDSAFAERSFVVSQRHGIWGRAQLVRGGSGAGLAISALSCPSAGNCVAAGSTSPLAGGTGAFAVTEAHGRWGTATSLPGTFKLGYGIEQLGCPAAGACSAVGFVSTPERTQTFVSTEKNGIWHNPQVITGAGPGHPDFSGSLSCAAGGSCVLFGGLAGAAAVAVQVNGRWGPARILRGVRAVARGRADGIGAVSCPARSRCTAIGSFGVPYEATGQMFAVVQR
jgi:hypothetical protein